MGPVKRAEIEPRAVVSWEGPGEPIVLTLYGADGEVALPLLPKRALTLAQELLTRGVQAIKADTWDAMYDQGARASHSSLATAPHGGRGSGAADCRTPPGLSALAPAPPPSAAATAIFSEVLS